jgi:SAM-dependent methyltransferase
LTRQFVYGGDELETLAGATNYYAWLARLLSPHVGRHVVEIGAGVGTLAAAVLATNPAASLTLFEPASNNLPTLTRRFANEPRVRIVPGFYEPPRDDARPVDTVLVINVLEHVDDCRALLAAVHETLRPGGRLAIIVPAGGAMLYGSLDKAFDHHQRFTSTTLRALVEESGYLVHELRFLNALGVIPWFLMGRVMHMRNLPRFAVRLYDRVAIPVLSRLERVWSPPYGQSLFVVAEPRE